MVAMKQKKFAWLKSLLKQGFKEQEFAAEDRGNGSETEDDEFPMTHGLLKSDMDSAQWRAPLGQPTRHPSSLAGQGEGENALNTNQNFRIFIGTWNVGGRRPEETMNLEQWLTLTESADLYVIGFQEIVPLNAGNVFGVEDKSSVEQWLHLIQNALNKDKHCDAMIPSSRKRYTVSDGGSGYLVTGQEGDAFFKSSHSNLEFSFPFTEDMLLDECFGGAESGFSFRSPTSDDNEREIGCHLSSPQSPPQSLLINDKASKNSSHYSLIASKRMVGIFLSVWVRSNLRGCVQHVKIASVGCGIMGYLGNKGSIAVSVCLHRTTFCFICSHLTSGEKEGDELRRNYDVSVILKRTRFHRSSKKDNQILPGTILDHDRILWFGDLNYRLALSLTSTKLLLAKADWERLLEWDQLHIERRAGRVFKGWNEGKICFPPTYKYRMGSDSYAVERMKIGEKQRTPAWCDRILWYGKGLKQLEYVRAESNFSDHRPVYAVFSAEVEVPDSKELGDLVM